MKKTLITAVLVFVFGSLAFAQDEPQVPEEKKGFDKEKMFFGGNFGANFGDYTLVNLSPQLGYRFNRYIAAGVGINGIYSSFKYRDFNNVTYARSNYSVIGLNVFGRVYPIEQILIQAQPELNYVTEKLKEYYPGGDRISKRNGLVPSLLVGAGGAIPTGRNGAVIVMAQYDVLNSDRTPYGSRIFYSFGFNAGF
ncbi:MAG: hypothetical protein H7Y27_13875 [Gemmatimonadaceae bacterium]|nr:hypothetical protein [Chitinophagaceae bacterium]